jgi:hypothetical protein
MPNRPHRDPTESTEQMPPDHHRGGQELPDDVQDRPEQNAGYDAAVNGEVEDELDLSDLDQVLEDLERGDGVDDDGIDEITH